MCARFNTLGRWPLFGALFGLVIVATRAPAGDWPQWRGPKGDAISTEKDWGHDTLNVLWQTNVGRGYSAVAVSGGKVFTLGNADREDTLWCFDEANGEVLWKDSYACKPGSYPGPRATPTVAGNMVYTVSYEGHVGAWTTDGKRLWLHNVAREIGAREPQWGFAGSVLVEGRRLIVNIGTAGTCLDRATGKVIWTTGKEAAGYATPVPAAIGNQKAYLIFAAKELVLVNAGGKRLTAYPWSTRYDVNAADPIMVGGNVFISSNYGTGCALLKLAGSKPTVVWQNKAMRNHFNTCVLLDGHLYGTDEAGDLVCMALSNGEVKWRQGGFGKGGLMAAAGKLIVQADKGDLCIVEVSSAAYKELARKKVLGGTCWTYPVLVNGRIYCRNERGDLVCLEAK